ncbi:MAG: hypothetical protein Q9199_003859 [Rusavskia elegans]
MAGYAVWRQVEALEQVEGRPLVVRRGPASSTGSNLQATITPAPATTQCPPCQILVSAGDGGMSRVFWWNSTLDLTLDTVSVVVTQYNSTAITRTTTVFGDVNSLDPLNITEVQNLRYSFDNQQYPGQPGIILVNDTKGVVEGSLSFPYPTSYLVAPGYDYYTQIASGPRYDEGCPAGQSLSGDSNCVCRLATVDLHMNVIDDKIFSKTATRLSQTFYATMTPDGQPNLEQQLSNNIIDFDVALFSSWLASVNPRPPKFESCYFPAVFVGPPALKVPVSALTATISTTVTGTQHYSWTSATPALGASTVIPAETSRVEAFNMDKPTATPEAAPSSAPLVAADRGDAANDQSIQTALPPDILSGDSTDVLGSSSEYVIESRMNAHGEGSQAFGLPISIAVGESIAIDKPYSQPLPTQDLSKTPVLPFLGSAYTMESSSIFVIDGQTLTPGGTVTISGSVVPVPALTEPHGQSSPQQTIVTMPVMYLGSSPYLMDTSSNFVLDGQTIAPGRAITISGTAISRPSGDSLVVLGGKTETLSQVVMTMGAHKVDSPSLESGMAFGPDIDGSTSIRNASAPASSTLATPTVERTETASDGIATAGSLTAESLGKGPVPSRPTASGGAESPVNPADSENFQYTASASALRSVRWVTFGLCVGLCLVARVI